MSRIISLVALLIVLGAGFTAWKVFAKRGDTGISFIIPEGRTDKASVLEIMEENKIIPGKTFFSLIASPMGVWKRIRAGRYEIKKGESLFNIARMLRNGKISAVNLVINKLRLKEDLAKLISKNFSTDSASVMNYLNSPGMMESFGVDTANVFTLIIPDTYTFYWNTSLDKIMQRLSNAKNAFWKKNERLAKAQAMGFTPQEVYILASIVEEETNIESDKYKIASVYINRLNKEMALQACPTIKYAMKDFALTRIYEKYLFNPSPYNTYRRKGLPPGPICTPSPKTIDVVLNAPKTDYLFFVAKSDFSGYSHFSSNFAEHSAYAKEYQKALDARMLTHKQTGSNP